MTYKIIRKVRVCIKSPSSIYSWSIGHILEHEFFCFGRLGSKGSKGSKGKKVDLRNSEQLLRVVFSTIFLTKDEKTTLKSCSEFLKTRLPLKF